MAHIEIDGKPYELPTLDTITLDEERVLYIYSDTVVQDFVPVHPEATEEEKAAYNTLQLRKIRNPDFKKALAHIAYRRENPEAEDAEIQRAIGLVNALAVDIAMLRGDDDDSPPTSSQTPPESGTSSSEPSSSTASGSPTANGSALPGESPEATGATRSATSSPGARPSELVS